MTANTVVAIDIGYGDIKVYLRSDNNVEHYFKFTNAISFAGNSSVSSAQNALEVFKFNDQEYIVGDDALWNNPFTARRYQYLYDYAPLLVYKAFKMAKLIESIPAKLSTVSQPSWNSPILLA